MFSHSEYIGLVNKAKKASYEYYVMSNSSLLDADFDLLVDTIASIEDEHPDWTLPDSPTQKVGSDLSDNGRRRIAHRTPMLSCQKAQTVEAVDKWLVKIRPNIRRDLGRFLLMWKYDGISCSLVYQDGKLIEASTRGEDGLIGQDILDHVRMMQNVPQQLEATNDFMRKSNALKGRVEVRGEVVCKKANLKLMRNQYKDCRSAASSLCNMMEPDTDCELLQFCVWDVIADRWNYGPEANIGLDMAKASGFKDVYYVCNNLEDGYHFGDTLQRYFDAEKREALEFPTDGVVIRVNHRSDFKALGATAHHPKGSIAYKFAAAKTVSRVTRIEVTVGKTGRRTPVVHFEPVMILGREVKKASLGSERMLEEMGVKRGDMVEVGLANDVRPTIYRVIEPAQHQASPVSPDSTTPSASPQGSVGDKVTENDPLAGIDFPGEETPVAHDLFAATPVDDSVLGDSVAEEEEEPWLAPSLFSDDSATVPNAPATVPDASPSGSTAPTVLGDSVAENEAPNHSHHRTAAILGTVVCAALLCCVGAVVMAAAVFFVPILAGTLRV